MNYCQSCRRHLNGAVSCPGCGAIGVVAPETQDSHSTDWMTEVAWPERDPLPTAESRSAAGTGKRADGDAARAHSNVERAGTRSAASAKDSRAPAAKLAHAALARTGDSASDVPTGRRIRRSRKRHGLGLKATVTGGFAGIAVIGLLVLGNLPTAGGAAPAGAVAAVATSATQSPGGSSNSAAPTQLPTNGGSSTGSGPKATASSSASATSPSPGSSKTPGPSGTSATSTTSATSAQGAQSTGPSTVSSGAQSSSPATQPTTPSPSPSKPQVSCILIICW